MNVSSELPEHTSFFVVSQEHLDRWQKNNNSDRCKFCMSRLRLGEETHSKPNGNGKNVKRHLLCSKIAGIITQVQYKKAREQLKDKRIETAQSLQNRMIALHEEAKEINITLSTIDVLPPFTPR